jgi:hypothetical protein
MEFKTPRKEVFGLVLLKHRGSEYETFMLGRLLIAKDLQIVSDFLRLSFWEREWRNRIHGT